MKQNIMADLSAELESLVKKTAPFLVHIGGEDVPYRTGVVWDSRHIVTTAAAAREGEEVTVLGAAGMTVRTTVRGFDGRTGIALLESDADLGEPAWEGERPAVGALAATVAFPSPAGPEAVLSMARCVGEDYFQTDAGPYPGFSGAAVVAPSGKLWGVVASNAAGNRGQAVPFAELARLAAELGKSGSRRRRVLGVRTQPVGEGLLVTEVSPDSAAREAGLLVGDILAQLGDKELKHPFDLLEALEKSEGNIVLTIVRGGKNVTLQAEPHLETETAARSWRHGWKHGWGCGR